MQDLKTRIHCYCLVVLVVATTAWAFDTATTLPSAHVPSSYVLGPDDLISIRILQAAELADKPVRIDLNGFIDLPFIGRVRAAGNTVELAGTGRVGRDLDARRRPLAPQPRRHTRSGARAGSQPQTCPSCRGAGQVRVSQGPFSIAQTCPRCHGSGRIIPNPSTACAGTPAERMSSKNGLISSIRKHEPNERLSGSNSGYEKNSTSKSPRLRIIQPLSRNVSTKPRAP